MSRVHTLWVVAFSLVGTRSPARAEEDGPQPVNTTASVSAGADDDIMHGHEVASVSTSDRVQGHPAGTYTGVAPGGSATPAVGVRAGQNPATITWPGFQMRPDGTSRVFIQSTAPMNPQPSAAPGKYLVLLPGARVSGGTNRLPLETRFFNTPVTRVSLSVNRDGAQLILDLRADVAPQLSSERGSTGYYFTYIDLPKGSFVVAVDKAKASSAASAAAVAATVPGTGPAELTTELDSASHAAAAAHATRSAEHELPPGVKAHTSVSGGLRLGK
jgi:hypothetical protein